jgi:hypothetical protein
MIDQEGRETVTVKKAELLEVLTKNREQHRDTFEKALLGWKKKVTDVLAEAYDDAQTGKRYQNYISIEQPTDQTRDYDRVIKMVQMSVSDTVMLTREHFACYVMDDWKWKDQFTRSTSMYTKD